MTSVFIPFVNRFNGMRMTREFDTTYSIHLSNVMTREEFAWAIGKLNHCVHAHQPSPWIMFAMIMMFVCVTAIIVPVAMFVVDTVLFIVLGCVFGFVFIMMIFIIAARRRALIRLAGELGAEVAHLNQHFAGRANFILRIQHVVERHHGHYHHHDHYGVIIEIPQQFVVQQVVGFQQPAVFVPVPGVVSPPPGAAPPNYGAPPPGYNAQIQSPPPYGAPQYAQPPPQAGAGGVALPAEYNVYQFAEKSSEGQPLLRK